MNWPPLEADGAIGSVRLGFGSCGKVSPIWRAITTFSLLDPPPALGTISLAVMQAANALLVPLAATTPDFCSTVQFLSMMDQVLQQLGQCGHRRRL